MHYLLCGSSQLRFAKINIPNTSDSKSTTKNWLGQPQLHAWKTSIELSWNVITNNFIVQYLHCTKVRPIVVWPGHLHPVSNSGRVNEEITSFSSIFSHSIESIQAKSCLPVHYSPNLLYISLHSTHKSGNYKHNCHNISTRWLSSHESSICLSMCWNHLSTFY